MMCESAESIDDPSNIINQVHDCSPDEINAFCSESSLMTDNIVNNSDSPVIPGLLLCLENDNKIQLPQNTSVINTSLSTPLVEEETPEQEPVLINIIDEGRTSENGGSVLLIKTSRPFVNDEIRSVQLITKDSSGRVLLETAEIISQYNHSESA